MLQNKNIVVIGGTSGMGLSAAKAFGKQGARVIAVGNQEETNRQAQQELGSSARVFAGDATAEDTATQAIALCLQEWGSFDGLYHVAGGSGRRLGDGPLHELSLEGWKQTLDMNLTSVMLSNRA
ncbi:MAG: SDR family NAD(P)-dependent oxidoreductase, partial [Adhaeribacter sp.]